MKCRAFANVFVWFTTAALVIGCRGSDDKWIADRPKVAPAEGVVTFKGMPVEGATIVFAPASGTNAASGLTGSGGRFSLSAFPPDAGTVPGKYKVSITKREQPAPPAAASHDELTTETPPKNLLPDRYGEPETSGLTADIPAEGKKDLKFDLTE